MPTNGARPTLEQKEKIRRHLVMLLKLPSLCQQVQDVREALGLQQVKHHERGRVWVSPTDNREKHNRYAGLLARAWFSGIGEEKLAFHLLSESWEEQDVREVAGQIEQWLFSHGVTEEAERLVRPWYPHIGSKKQMRKIASGPIWTTPHTFYYGGKGPLHPTRVWQLEELKTDLEGHAPTLMRPIVGSCPIRRRASRMFIEVEPWAVDEDVKNAYRYCVEPFLAQGQRGARALPPHDESPDCPPLDERGLRRKLQLRRSRPATASPIAEGVSLPRHNRQGKEGESED